MPTRPDTFPDWARVPSVDPIVGGSNVVEPSEAKKDKGWERKEKPPANIQNWLHKLAGEWIKYLDFAEGSVLWGGISTGTDPNYLVEVPHGVTAYFEGMTIAFIPNFTIGNTAQATINVKQTGESFIGAKNVRNMADNNIGGSAGGFTFGGGIAAGSVCIATFYNDEWVIVSATPRVNDPTLTAKQIMEAANNLVTYPSPGDLINHPGIAKVVCSFDAAGNINTAHSYNVGGPITKPTVGRYTIPFSVTFADANYVVTGIARTVQPPGNQISLGLSVNHTVSTTAVTVVATDIITHLLVNAPARVAIFGKLA